MKLAWILWLSSFSPTPMADSMCLATTIYLEARNQSTEGQLAVAEVALRRRDSGRYGNQLCEVLTQPKQFALTLVSPDKEINDWKAFGQSWRITMEALRNWQLPEKQRKLVVPGADHFLAYQQVSTVWASGEPLHIIGDHGFYRVN
jgi:spore germination cell wall hydrolase CwlJ-like protein